VPSRDRMRLRQSQPLGGFLRVKSGQGVFVQIRWIYFILGNYRP
jgi:hypothetical protein